MVFYPQVTSGRSSSIGEFLSIEALLAVIDMFPIVKISYGFLSLENILFIEDLLTIADILFIEKALIAYKRFYIPL